MKTLITGHKGFIGKHLVEHLFDDDLILLESDFMLEDKWEQKLIGYVDDADIIYHIGAISDTTLQDCNEMLKYN